MNLRDFKVTIFFNSSTRVIDRATLDKDKPILVVYDLSIGTIIGDNNNYSNNNRNFKTQHLTENCHKAARVIVTRLSTENRAVLSC